MKKLLAKFDRKRAIECKLIGESKLHEGYWDYEVKVGGKDGITYIEPAFGKDMSNALNRLLWRERADSLEMFVTRKSVNVMTFFWVIAVLIPSGISSVINSPIPITIVLIINFLAFLGWKSWNYWVTR